MAEANGQPLPDGGVIPDTEMFALPGEEKKEDEFFKLPPEEKTEGKPGIKTEELKSETGETKNAPTTPVKKTPTSELDKNKSAKPTPKEGGKRKYRIILTISIILALISAVMLIILCAHRFVGSTFIPAFADQ